MRVLASLLAGASVALVVSSFRPPDVGSVVGRYLVPVDHGDQPKPRRQPDVSWVPWVAAGMIVGLLAAQGDLFSHGVQRPPLLLGLLGGVSGWTLFSVRRTNARERRSRTLRLEVPVLADVHASVEDWMPMRQRMSDTVATIKASPPKLPPDEVVEASEFLEWLTSNHFTFLGVRDYDLVREAGDDVLRIVAGSGVGMLREKAVV